MSRLVARLAVVAVLASVLAGCATGTRESTTLRATRVECQVTAERQGTGAPGAAMSAYDCVAADGRYTAADPLTDFKLWLALAQAGEPLAQTRVGSLYEEGLSGIAPDHDSAATWYRRAVRQEYAPAMLRLAVLAEKGLGMRRDPDYARDLVRRASRGRNAPIAPPRLYLVEPTVLLSGLAPAATARVDRPEGRLELLGRVVASGERQRTLLVDGKAVKTDAEGYFRAAVELRREGTPLQLQATDAGGRTTQVQLRLLPGRADEPPARAATPVPGLHALLIANQDYRHHEKLDTPLNDARAIRQVLERRYGFRTTLLQNATRRDVLAALAALREKLSANDELVVYYAGHGEIDPATQRAYWIPVDARRGDASDWISTVEVSDQLQAVEARRVLLIVDSCYAGAVNQRALSLADADLAADRQSVFAVRSGGDKRTRVALSSGGLEPVSDGIGGRHSLYANALLEVLGAASGPLTAEQVHGEVVARFRWRAMQAGLDQRPRYGPVRIAGHEAGDFTLVPRGR